MATSASELARYVNKPTKRIDALPDLIAVELVELDERNNITHRFWVI